MEAHFFCLRKANEQKLRSAGPTLPFLCFVSLAKVVRETRANVGLQGNANDLLDRSDIGRIREHLGCLAGVTVGDQEVGRNGHAVFQKRPEHGAAKLGNRSSDKSVADRLGSNVFVLAAKLQPQEFESKFPEPNMFGPMPASGFFLRHVRNLEMSHVEIANATPDARPAFHLTEIDRADFFAVTAPRGADGAFALHGVKDLRIGWSRAAADTILSSVDSKVL